MLEPIENKVETLIKLGLTSNQAKIYLSCASLGRVSVKQISKYSNVLREDVYRILPGLEKKGLIKKFIDTPALYEAIEPKLAIKILLSSKTEEISQLRKQSISFVNNFKFYSNILNQQPHDDLFSIISNDDIAINTLTSAIKQAKKTWVFTTGYDRLIFRLNMSKKSLQVVEMVKALQRGVIIRAVLDMPKDGRAIKDTALMSKTAKAFVTHKNFQYKYISGSPDCLLSIFDDNLTFIETERGRTVLTPQFWSNNNVFICLGKAYFEMLWETAKIPQ